MPPPTAHVGLSLSVNLPGSTTDLKDTSSIMFASTTEPFHSPSVVLKELKTPVFVNNTTRENRTIQREYLLYEDSLQVPHSVYIESEIGDHPDEQWDLKMWF